MKNTETSRTRPPTLYDRCIITGFLSSFLSTKNPEASNSSVSSSLTWKDYAIPAALFSFLFCLFAYEHFFG